VASLTVRDANVEDVEGIRAVGEACWPDTYAFAGEEYIEHGLASWWSEVTVERSLRDTTVVVAVDEDGRVVGMGNVDLRGEVPTVWKVYVLAETRGTGVGTALLDAAPVRRIPKSADAVRLEYVAGNDQAARFLHPAGLPGDGADARGSPRLAGHGLGSEAVVRETVRFDCEGIAGIASRPKRRGPSRVMGG